MILFSRNLLLLGALGSACVAAELEVSPDDLPRIPPSSPAEALKKFQIKDGFEIQLVAAEPLVVDPIAMCFDENSRLYVIEINNTEEAQKLFEPFSMVPMRLLILLHSCPKLRRDNGRNFCLCQRRQTLNAHPVPEDGNTNTRIKQI